MLNINWRSSVMLSTTLSNNSPDFFTEKYFHNSAYTQQCKRDRGQNYFHMIPILIWKITCFRCTQIKTYSWDNAQVILVGNKCDMEDERVISFERGKQLADSLGLEFFETSAKDNINVRVSFTF